MILTAPATTIASATAYAAKTSAGVAAHAKVTAQAPAMTYTAEQQHVQQ